MGLQIEDGTGTGQSVGVSPTGNRMNVSARSDERIYYISRDNGDAYATTSIDTAAAGEYNFYFKNTSATKKFYVSTMTFGSAVLAIFKVTKVTGTAGGAGAIAITNLNMTSGNVADATVLGNAAVTGLTAGDDIVNISVTDDDSHEHNFHDALILGTNDAIAVEYDTGAGGTIHITMTGFFDEA
jgi:hypothetical protein